MNYDVMGSTFSTIWWFSMKMPVISALTSILPVYTKSSLKNQTSELDHTHLIPIGAQSVNCAQVTLVTLVNP